MSDSNSNNATNNTSSSAGLNFSIHPLVIMSIADHHTRLCANVPKPNNNSNNSSNDKEKVESPPPPRALGVLYGTQEGRTVSILDSVEIAYKRLEDGSISFLTYKDNDDAEVLQVETDMKLFATCYPALECLGWYLCGPMEKRDMEIQRLIAQYNERPILLVLDPSAIASASNSASNKNNSDSLPIALYEENISIVDGETVSTFVRSSSSVIESDEAERITMIHCAKVISSDDAGSQVTHAYGTLVKSVQSLRDRIQLIHNFLKDVKAGKLKADQPTLREIKGLLNRLPTMTSADFRKALAKEHADGLLITLLASMTQGADEINSLTDKFQIANANERRRGGGGGGDRYDDMAMAGMGGMMGMGAFGRMGMGGGVLHALHGMMGIRDR